MASKSSQLWLFLFAILALSVYIETTTVEALTCNAGETYVETPIIAVGPRGSCSRSLSDCDNRCAGQGRPVRYKQCQIIGFLQDWTRCQACCGAPPPRPSPSPPPPSPPPPSPPPPSPPPPPPSDPRDLCGPGEISLSSIATSCSLCPVCNCGAGVTPALAACISNYCSCCCLTTLTSSSMTPGSSLFAVI
ncbi:hypothetical protein MKX01_031219 [Papaver californicum]|nr:hypothetical protein MKX01_031219 [Papaver californicum]